MWTAAQQINNATSASSSSPQCSRTSLSLVHAVVIKPGADQISSLVPAFVVCILVLKLVAICGVVRHQNSAEQVTMSSGGLKHASTVVLSLTRSRIPGCSGMSSSQPQTADLERPRGHHSLQIIFECGSCDEVASLPQGLATHRMRQVMPRHVT